VLSLAWCAGIFMLFSTIAVTRFARRRYQEQSEATHKRLDMTIMVAIHQTPVTAAGRVTKRPPGVNQDHRTMWTRRDYGARRRSRTSAGLATAHRLGGRVRGRDRGWSATRW
jgi:hypothetical protein